MSFQAYVDNTEHVGSTGSHRVEPATLRLDGRSTRP